jgi:hypothetical protein
MFALDSRFTWKRPTTAKVYVWEEKLFMTPEEAEVDGMSDSPRLRPNLSLVIDADYVMAKLYPAKRQLKETYTPFQDGPNAPPALYRILAETPPTQEGILGFVSRYGLLGKGVECPALREREREPDEDDDGEDDDGPEMILDHRVEPLIHWQCCILSLRQVVRIWDQVQADDRRALAVFAWLEKPQVLWYRNHLKKDPNAWEETLKRKSARSLSKDIARWHHRFKSQPEHLMGLNPIDPNNPIQLGTIWVLRCLTAAMQNLVLPQAHWDATRKWFVPGYQPLSLLGAIYLQFMTAVYQQTPARSCEVCGKWFEIVPGITRSDRTTCSGTCRNRLYFARRERARQLFGKGKKPEQIALELGSEEAIIKNWVTKKGE